jgi:hypothetical protein
MREAGPLSARRNTEETRACEKCGGPLAWESNGPATAERWLGRCLRCDWMITYLPAHATYERDDPLGRFLTSEITAASPAWARAFAISQQFPWLIHWKHVTDSCCACRASVVFRTREHFPNVSCHYWLCLNCGHTQVEYRIPRHEPETGDRVAARLSGEQWTPPCPAVKKLRRALFNERRWRFWFVETEG